MVKKLYLAIVFINLVLLHWACKNKLPVRIITDFTKEQRQNKIADNNILKVSKIVDTKLAYSKDQQEKIFKADIDYGIIGYDNENPIDEPYDNVFHIHLPSGVKRNHSFVLQYWLNGVSSNTGIARSINDAQALGGQFVLCNNEWTLQREFISAENLHEGDNIVRFSLPDNATYSYKIKNLSVVAIYEETDRDQLLINNPDDYFFGKQVYIKGVLKSAQLGSARLYCNDHPVSIYNNEFEISEDEYLDSTAEISLRAEFGSGKTITKNIVFKHSITPQFVFKPSQKGLTNQATYLTSSKLNLSSKVDSATAISIPAKALNESKTISITALRDIDIPALNADMVNVTKTHAAFRFLPHGSKFSKAARLSIPFDSTLIPDGYTTADIKTFFFNESSKKWEELPLDTINKMSSMVTSYTTHFTDMINGIIKVPESPQTQGYIPTSIKDFKAADPSNGITFINPPEANNTGGASLSFNLKLPAGRLGMQPQLTLRYSNEGGNGWMGLGWNISLPFVGIETRWGVPRYDASLETEEYTLSGEQLAPVVRGSTFVARSAGDKQFYSRVEGAFNKVIRKGTGPKNYWWEVTNKNGTKNTYGGENGEGVLKDENGNVTYWALVETKDLNGNYVKYVYETIENAGVVGSTILGKQLYIKEIVYTGHDNVDGPYHIEFIRKTGREDIDINCRTGLKVVTADLLDKVKISMNGQPIRAYQYNYTEGAFKKTLLKSFSELDADGNIFYSHKLDYYDDVNAKNGYAPLSTAQNWSIASDGIKGDISRPIDGFRGEASALNTSKSSSINGGLALTVGSWAGGLWSKLLSVGGSFGYGSDNQEGLISIIDVNGDGLPDKVFKLENQFYYRKNLGFAAKSFGEKMIMKGAEDFSKSNSQNVSWGFQVIPFVLFYGRTTTTTTSSTTNYFSDFNGDGLIDIASNGRVLFNHLNSNGDPEFNENSGLTPAPVKAGAVIDPAFLKSDADLQKEQEDNFPLQDAVRFWQAPFDGIVSIDAPIRLREPLIQDYKKGDGVRVSVQLNGIVKWADTISVDNFFPKTPTGLESLTVAKGDRIYFRLQSIYNGVNDVISWDQSIKYLTPVSPLNDANNKPSDNYKASSDFFLSAAGGGYGMPRDGVISFDAKFIKKITSDEVRVTILQQNASSITTYSDITYTDSQLVDTLFQKVNINVNKGDTLRFIANTDTYIDRTELVFLPHIIYTDGITPLIETKIVPDFTNYNDWVKPTKVLKGTKKDTIRIIPYIQFDPTADGTIVFSIKSPKHIINKQKRTLLNGVLSAKFDTVLIIRNAGDELFVEYTTPSHVLSTKISILKYQLEDTIYYRDVNNVPRFKVVYDTLDAGLYASPEKDFLGTLYRGWGCFAIKGDLSNLPINESDLNVEDLKQYPSRPIDTALYRTNPGSLDQLNNPALNYFIQMFPNAEKQTWMAYDSMVFVGRDTMGSSRLVLHDVSTDIIMLNANEPSPQMGGALSAAFKVSKTRANSTSAGVSFGLSYTKGSSNAETITLLDMMDMNGDRYPDVLNENEIQYTLPDGGLGNERRINNSGSTKSIANSSGVSLGGTLTVAGTEAVTTGKGGTILATKTASNSIGISGNIDSRNYDETVATWLDMNGDGLPDKVWNNGSVALNLGYGFAPAENWSISGIDGNESTSEAAGLTLGVNIDASSFQAGYNLTKTNGNSSSSLIDINGDGLPDKVLQDGSIIKVNLNTGNGFAPQKVWQGFNSITKNVSIGESINLAYTISIPIFIPFFPIKICINPSGSIGHGVSRRKDQIMDVDGDNYPDLLSSENDGNLTVSSSTIGRTNMLKKIERPMGGYIGLDYERMGNTYEMPQSKWVLKNTEVFDGFIGDGVDVLRKTFVYKNGFQDRREREFLGFDTVITNELDGSAVYRKKIKVFRNDTYYSKGLLLSEWTENAGGNKYIKTDNEYEIKNITNNVFFPALTKTEKLFYEGAATAGVTTFSKYEYDDLGNIILIFENGDGSAKDEVLAKIRYHNNDLLYIKSLPDSIEVITGGAAKRRRSAKIDAQGNIIEIDQYITDDSIAIVNMEYDAYGNLSRIIKPHNRHGQRMWYQYEYDNITHGLVTKVSDAFGYSSSSTYDYRFGQLTGSVSMNDEKINYSIDSKGRISAVTGPYEIAAGKSYTIAFNYFPDASVPYAVTKHYDPEHDGDIKTITFMDGLGRALQVKKQIALFKNKAQDDELKMVVSGRAVFDVFGRTIENYYPIVEAIGPNNIAFNYAIGKPNSKTNYDILDRQVKTVLADGATTSMTYSIKNRLFSIVGEDPLGNTKETFMDVKERNRQTNVNGGPNGAIITKFDYNALNELEKVTDNNGNIIQYKYDDLGRKVSVQHPDAGLTEFVFDRAGNMIKKITPEIRKRIPDGGGIEYQYEYERLTDIDYPFQYQNKVKYTYGTAGSKAGRLVLQQDASGGQEFFYGKLGEVTKTIRTVLITPEKAVTFVSEQLYDTWNRIKTMIYPDGDSVIYHYNRGGALQNITSRKLGNEYKCVERLGYDEYEQRVYLKYGNGTETFYNYDDKRRRLTTLQSFTHGTVPIMNNTYAYDFVSNILGIENNVQAQAPKLGGYAKQEYKYDNLYRLIEAGGIYKGFGITTGYSLSVGYDDLYNIVSKEMKDSLPRRRYNQLYIYGGTAPHQATQVGDNKYSYDLNGNLLGDSVSENFWDEENRLMGVIKNGVLSRYTYDAKGERVIKSSGGVQGLWINGAPAGGVKHYDNFTAYVSPYLVYRKSGFSKHYYIENQRIITRLGNGEFINSSFPVTGLSAGGVDYTKRIRTIEYSRAEWYKTLKMPAASPIDKPYWLRPENNGIVPPIIIDSSASSVPLGWPSGPSIPREDWLPPAYPQGIPPRDSVKAGYGYDGTGLMFEKDQYFYHSDHLGSSSYITDALGEVNQHYEYTPFGETFFDEHLSSFKTPYLFNGKEKDEETGLYYYGARYYDARNSLWLSVDPKAEKYPDVSPYNFCLNNPLRLLDPNGKEVDDVIPNSCSKNDFIDKASYNENKIDPDHTNRDIATGFGFKFADQITDIKSKGNPLSGKFTQTERMSANLAQKNLANKLGVKIDGSAITNLRSTAKIANLGISGIDKALKYSESKNIGDFLSGEVIDKVVEKGLTLLKVGAIESNIIIGVFTPTTLGDSDLKKGEHPPLFNPNNPLPPGVIP
ncbi:SpvB/TcaC N-terminal domain-containing protein [Ferruginibacter sp. SUN002]|uniref:SpvB/TcaC N-terminal domain-containing protein n=1 Tax=Ferruginibacter sp. SUN002 TaxID=2937789 RepID=UPI003D365423